MAEMPDVIAGEVIETDWGNDLRDRTIQRYASSAARAASVPSPNAGDLSFLSDSGLVYVYAGGAWILLGGQAEVDNSTEVASVNLTTSAADVASVSLSIPAVWLGWKCMAYATGRSSVGTAAAVTYLLRIDGTDQQEQGPMVLLANGGDSFAVGGRRTGMTTTGSRTVSLRAYEATADVVLADIFLYARAVRTS